MEVYDRADLACEWSNEADNRTGTSTSVVQKDVRRTLAPCGPFFARNLAFESRPALGVTPQAARLLRNCGLRSGLGGRLEGQLMRSAI